MADPKLTPEEKLLRIIESPTGAASVPRPQRRLPDLRQTLKLLAEQYAPKLKELLNLKTINAVIVFLAALATVFLGLDFGLGLPRLASIRRIERVAKKWDIGDITIEHLEPVTVYLQEITQRNIFALPPPVDQQPVVKKAEPSPVLTNLKSNLKIVGIMWSEAPQVMIEDSKDNRTYLLNRGSTIQGARVKEILKDRVILSYDDQDVELR